MASNTIKKLSIELDSHSFADLAGMMEERVIEAIQELIEENCSSLDGLGDDGTTELELDAADVNQVGDGLEATIYFNRVTGKFASTQDVEDEVIRILDGSDIEISFTFKITV